MSLKRKILTNESSLLQTFLLWVLYLSSGQNWAQKAGVRESSADKKLFLPQIVRYKVASVNKTVQTYQQGNFSTRHVKSLQTKLMSIMRAICSVKHLHRRNVNSYLWLSSLLERPVTRLWRVLATQPVLGIFLTTRTLLGKSIIRPSSE